MQRLLGDEQLAKAMGDAGRRSVHARFSVERLAARWRSLLDEELSIVESRRSRHVRS
jgi:hypothetical protein